MSNENGQGEYGDYSVDEEDQPGAEDMLDEGGPREGIADELDKGYSPPERYSVAQGYGNTHWEASHRQGLDQRLAEEIPDEDPYAEEADDGVPHEDGDSREVGDRRAGRLVDAGGPWRDEPSRDDQDSDVIGQDVGIDGEGASAEEAAVHVISEEPGESGRW
ncbi:DUF5709 domain-containing protein [Nocardioides insulae]|uniref:DUF5709 domain-containing protein n=1 Tax=Nocardioides insulae TaxID=394734 RepID=UPI00040DC4BC|nr:DUF5709 domain-containing protein [Nocardioides insulae]